MRRELFSVLKRIGAEQMGDEKSSPQRPAEGRKGGGELGGNLGMRRGIYDGESRALPRRGRELMCPAAAFVC